MRRHASLKSPIPQPNVALGCDVHLPPNQPFRSQLITQLPAVCTQQHAALTVSHYLRTAVRSNQRVLPSHHHPTRHRTRPLRHMHVLSNNQQKTNTNSRWWWVGWGVCVRPKKLQVFAHTTPHIPAHHINTNQSINPSTQTIEQHSPLNPRHCTNPSITIKPTKCLQQMQLHTT
jgi:hypothetical protein